MKMFRSSLCATAVLVPSIAAYALGAPQQSLQQAASSPVAVATMGTTGDPAAASTSAPDYRLGAGDKIRIEVYKEPQLSQSLQVRPDGKITMPLIGDLTAAGLTPIQLRDRIGTGLKEYVNNPVVTVMVVEAVASTVYVMGEVNKPGTIPLTGPLTVVQALSIAGGFRDFAKTGKIRILRGGPRGTETIKFNYDDAVKKDLPPVYLQRGDTVIVP